MLFSYFFLLREQILQNFKISRLFQKILKLLYVLDGLTINYMIFEIRLKKTYCLHVLFME